MSDQQENQEKSEKVKLPPVGAPKNPNEAGVPQKSAQAAASERGEATAVLVQAIHTAQSRGAYTLEESASIHQALRVLTNN